MAGPAIAAAISAGGQLLGTGINALQTGNLNRKNRQFSLDMYQRQYNDNVKFWELQNEYNDPAQQMERYKNAGLNPNLIYGSGSASAGNAGSISTPDVQPVNYRTTDVSGIGNAANAIARYQDFEIRQAQAEGLRLDNKYKAIRNVTAGYDSDSKLIDWNVKNFNWEEGLHKTQADSVRQTLQQQQANYQFTMNEDHRRAVKSTSDIAEATERILTMEKQRSKTDLEKQQIDQAIKNLKLDGSLKERELMMRELGWTPGSPAWMGVITTLINNLLGR